MKKLRKVLLLLLMTVLLCGNTLIVSADEDETNIDSDNNTSNDSPGDQYASDAWKEQVRKQLNRYYSDLKILYKLTDDQITAVLKGERIYVTGLKKKSGGTYSAYFTPNGVEPYSYTSDGAEKQGYQVKYIVEFKQSKRR